MNNVEICLRNFERYLAYNSDKFHPDDVEFMRTIIEQVCERLELELPGRFFAVVTPSFLVNIRGDIRSPGVVESRGLTTTSTSDGIVSEIVDFFRHMVVKEGWKQPDGGENDVSLFMYSVYQAGDCVNGRIVRNKILVRAVAKTGTLWEDPIQEFFDIVGPKGYTQPEVPASFFEGTKPVPDDDA